MKDGTWVNSIVKAMTELGGKARYDDLYQQVAKVRKKEGLPLNDSYKATIRGIVEAFSSDSDVWKKRPGPDIFRKLGTGYWGLRNPDTHISNTENLSLIERIKAEYDSGDYAKFEQEAKVLYDEFSDKFSPEKLAKLHGEDLLDTVFLGKNNKSMCYYLEHDPKYREIFGSIRGGTAAKYGLYYSKEFETWITGNWKTEGNRLNVNDAIQIGTNIRDAIVHACEVIESLTPFSVNLAYEELSRKLAEIKDLSENQWIRKYFHMIYPEYFPTWYGEDLIDKVLALCKLPSSSNLYGKLGEIVRFAKKCQVPNVVFPKIIDVLFGLREDDNQQELQNTEDKIISTTDMPLNQILYGAPGTGKTYNTVIKALEIITGKTYDLSNDLQERKKQYAEYLAEFNELKAQGQIEFVTFHPSTSYEEFVEGIKPVMQESEEQSDLQYKIEDGIFKRIAKRAGAETISLHGESIDFTKTRIFKMSLGQGTDNDIFKYCMENNVIANGYGNGIDFSGVKNKQDIIKKVESDNKYDFSVEAMNRFILWMKPGDIVLIADGKSSVAAIAQVEGEYEYKTDTEIDYTNFRKVKWLYKGDIPIKAIYNKTLSMQSIYAFYNESKKGTPEYNTNINTEYLNELISGKELSNKDKKYVLIIDEINRGNISKIFGELITLLEPTKRIGAAEEMRVTLPYSKKPFGVPSNLYIIGTMNTSDRSIASLDIALRRRFSFRAMRPEDNLVKDVENIQLNSIFKKMNKKIEILLDEDHMIGHSFLMKCQSVEDVKKSWFNEIMPLINEYFYGDWEKIKMVLGDDFVKTISIDDMPEDIKRYCNGETFYRFANIQDNLDDADFVNKLNKLA